MASLIGINTIRTATLNDIRGRIRDGFYRNQTGNFCDDLMLALGLSQHPKRDVLHRLAWDYGHSHGMMEVLEIADDLAELLR